MADFIKIADRMYEGDSGDTKPSNVPNGTICRYTNTREVVITYDGGSTWINADKRIRLVEEDGTFIDLLPALAAIIAAEASGTVTMAHTDPSIDAVTTTALAANANREYAMLINDSDETIYLKIGVDAGMNAGIRLNALGGSYEMSKKIGNLDVRVINAICASGTKELLVTEGV